MAVLVPSRPSESSSHLIISTGFEAYRMQRAKPSSSSTIQDLVMAQLSPKEVPRSSCRARAGFHEVECEDERIRTAGQHGVGG